MQNLCSTDPTQELCATVVGDAGYTAPTRQHLSWTIHNRDASALKYLGHAGRIDLPGLGVGPDAYIIAKNPPICIPRAINSTCPQNGGGLINSSTSFRTTVLMRRLAPGMKYTLFCATQKKKNFSGRRFSLLLSAA